VIWQQSMVLYDWPFAAVAAVTLLVSVLLIIGLIAALAQRVSRW
jgi:putative spermidine/putrescine transport system permease protein